MITFLRQSPGTHDETTGTWTSPATTLSLNCDPIQIRGSPQRYKDLGLVLSRAVTWFLTAEDYGILAYSNDFVLPGDTTEYNGSTWTVKEVDPNPAPDGVIIAARIIATR